MYVSVIGCCFFFTHCNLQQTNRKQTRWLVKQAVHVTTQYASVPCKLTISSYLFTRWHVGYLRHQNKLTFDLLTLKVVSESRLTWATSVPILVFLGLAVLELGLRYATDRRQTKTQK